MWRDIHLHLIHYIFLISILVSGLAIFVYLAPNPDKQFISVVITASLYFIWGLAHHHIEGDLHVKIMLEYLLISVLSIVVLRGVIFR